MDFQALPSPCMKEACGGDAFPGDPAWAPNDRGLMTGTRPGVCPSEFQPLPGAPGKPNPQTRTETQSHRPPPSCPPQDTACVLQGTPGLPGPCRPHSCSQDMETVGTPPTSGQRQGKPRGSTNTRHPSCPRKPSPVLAATWRRCATGQCAHTPSVHKSRGRGTCSAKAVVHGGLGPCGNPRRPPLRQDAATRGPQGTTQPCSQKTVPTA